MGSTWPARGRQMPTAMPAAARVAPAEAEVGFASRCATARQVATTGALVGHAGPCAARARRTGLRDRRVHERDHSRPGQGCGDEGLVDFGLEVLQVIDERRAVLLACRLGRVSLGHLRPLAHRLRELSPEGFERSALRLLV